ncbi:MAG: threonine--tRNA ligase [Patescibacteria group bacterium]
MSEEKNNKLGITRHSLAHIMALAIKQLFPEVKFGIGPAIENGFYYDFDLSNCEKKTFDPQDLLKIEKRMKKIIQQNFKFEKKESSFEKVKELFKNQPYKLELIEELKISKKLQATSYKLHDFVDLCAGPHIESTKEINAEAFKLTKIAGAYWLGDEKNKMLTRIYGLAFNNKTELDNYLFMMAEAEKRDHRKIGKEMELFMMHDVAPGMPFFLPSGMVMLNELIKFAREYSYGEGYREVRTPQLLNSELWKISGHWEYYQADMFCLHHTEDNIDIGIKSMNCPAHMLIFKQDIRSYRDLPLRIAETTTLYRKEKSGVLHGLTRVRSLSQDDTHIFLRLDQILDEILVLLDKVKNIYKIFDLQIDEIHLSTRPENYLGEKDVWDKAENNLQEALKKANLKYQINKGDGAFYGPKIDVKVKDAIGRQWQLATIQLDFQLPIRFGLSYIDSDGLNKIPVVIHRAILGSMERFLGVLIEHYAGAFPVWLSPVQVKIISVGLAHIEFCKKLATEFKQNDIRVEVDDGNETVGNKIRKAVAEKAPYMLVIGDREMASDKLNVRDRCVGTWHSPVPTREISKKGFIEKVKKEIKNK